MRLNYETWPLLLLLIIAILANCAKKPATVKGIVTDEENTPLAGAAVFSVPQKYRTLTDTMGSFILEGVEPGQYSLLVKYGDDSTLVNIGLVEPGEVFVTSIVLEKTPPPPPPPEEKPKPEPKPKPAPIKESPFVDPVFKNGERVLLLASEELFPKFEVESSDGLVWELKKTKTSNLKFKGGRMYEGYFSGPRPKYYETAARRCIYDDRLWIYTHGPENTPPEGREVYIAIPLELPANTDIDSLLVFYGFPRFPENALSGSVKFRIVGETSTGGISILVDWQKINHSSNGSFYKKMVPTLGDNRRLDYVSLEINSDGDAAWDAFLIRPLVYFSLR